MVQIETHCHTDESSLCGKVPGARVAELYAQKGYSTLIITDHYNCDVWKHDDWDLCMDEYLRGYKNALAAGEKLGINVLNAIELKLDGHDPYEFLVYGPDEAFLRRYPRLNEMTPPDFAAFAKAHGLLVFEAHPYRYTDIPFLPPWYDGVEVVNAHPRHDSHNRRAVGFALAEGKLMISGSDFHREQDCGRGGVMMDESVRTIGDFIESYRKNGSPELIITYEGE